MNSIQKCLTCLLLGMVVFTYSCKDDDDDPVGCNYATEIQAELNAVIDAGNAYGLDPTPAKCQAYVNAYQTLLTDMESHLECAALSGQQAQLQADIDQAQAELDNLQC